VRAAAALILFVCSAAAAAPRFAVVIGNDHGGEGRAKLWFAERDARRVALALRELGDFADDDVVLLEGQGRDEALGAVARLEQRIEAARRAGERTLLLLYYSGHADASGLQLGSQRLSFEELRRMVSASGADVKVAIIDACEAGTLTQVKGARPLSRIDFPLPGDDTVEGTAYVASTAVGELAQESAALGGSFFTHHLEVGLRGAADADDDARVTLAEAFRYAASRTVSGTLSTDLGPQHPTFEIRMSGRGDVVLADLRRAEARLKLPPGAGATYFIEGPRGLIAEVPGAATERVLGLPAGAYRIERRSGTNRELGQLTLAAGDFQPLPGLSSAPSPLVQSKSGREPIEVFAALVVGSGVLPNSDVRIGPRAGLRVPFERFALRGRFDLVRKRVDDQGLSYQYTSFGGALGPLFRLWSRGVRFEAGPAVGFAWTWQDVDNGEHFKGPDWSAGAAVVASVPVGPVHVGLEVEGAAHFLPLNGALAVRGTADGALLLSFGF
jgi:hypothetical protein